MEEIIKQLNQHAQLISIGVPNDSALRIAFGEETANYVQQVFAADRWSKALDAEILKKINLK